MGGLKPPQPLPLRGPCVMTIFSGALRELFKEEWRRFYGSKWRDRLEDGRRFSSNESFVNRKRNREALKTIVKGHS